MAGLSEEFGAAGGLSVVERVEGIGMTDYYGVSGRAAGPEQEQMTEAECERKVALLRASWTYFDDVAARVSPELRKGPRGGGREKDEIVRHVNGAEIAEFATKVGVRTLARRPAGPGRAARPSRRLLRGDPRDQRPRGRGGVVVDRPIPDPTMHLAHAGPCVGDGGPGPVLSRR